MTFSNQFTSMLGKPAFMQLLEQSLTSAEQAGLKLGLLTLDLDGHAATDGISEPDRDNGLLNTVAVRLSESIRKTDVAAYCGEENFAVMLVGPKAVASVVLVAERIRKNLSVPLFRTRKQKGDIGINIGIAVYPENGAGADHLMTVADHARMDSKGSGRNTSIVFKGLTREHVDIKPWLLLGEEHLLGIPELDEQHERLASLINKLCESIRNDEKAGADLLFDELIEAAILNFDTEARLMAETGYPLAEAHKRAQNFLLAELRYLKTRIIDGSDSEAYQLLQNWLVEHIEQDDRPMGEFLLIRLQRKMRVNP